MAESDYVGADSGTEEDVEGEFDIHKLEEYMKSFMKTSKNNAIVLESLSKKYDDLKSSAVSNSNIKCVMVKASDKRKDVVSPKAPPAKKLKNSTSDPGPSNLNISSHFHKPDKLSQRKFPSDGEIAAELDYQLNYGSQCKSSVRGEIATEPNAVPVKVAVSQRKAPSFGGVEADPIDNDNSSSVEDIDNVNDPDGDQLLAQYLISEASERGEDSDDMGGIPVLGSKEQTNWNPPKNPFKWFKTVADTELTEEQLEEFLIRFSPPADVEGHFEPPKLPNVIWNKISSGGRTDEYFKQRSLFKSQKLLTSTIKPLLTVLDSLNPTDPNQ